MSYLQNMRLLVLLLKSFISLCQLLMHFYLRSPRGRHLLMWRQLLMEDFKYLGLKKLRFYLIPYWCSPWQTDKLTACLASTALHHSGRLDSDSFHQDFAANRQCSCDLPQASSLWKQQPQLLPPALLCSSICRRPHPMVLTVYEVSLTYGIVIIEQNVLFINIVI